MLQLGKCIHGYVYRHGLVVDLFVWNPLVDMYGKCGNLELARTSTTQPNFTDYVNCINY
jgi:hypothetical protein